MLVVSDFWIGFMTEIKIIFPLNPGDCEVINVECCVNSWSEVVDECNL